MPWKWYNGKVVRKIQESSTTCRFWVETEEKVTFEAGQFVTMDLPIHEKRLKRWRSYSIANAPHEDLLEFCVVKLEGGLGSTYLTEEIGLGSEIKFKGPSGTFTLSQELNHDVVMICTGTGVAPFRSMIADRIHTGGKHKNIHLIFGTRYEEGILYREELEQWAENDWFTYDVVLSREEKWNGHKGYVHKVYSQAYAEGRQEGVHFYLCGWSQMIDEAVVQLMTKMNVEKEYIHYELYG